MTESAQVKTAGEIQCGCCQQSNASGVKFCAGCGHGLFESCFKCSKPVLLTQKYCGACGGDLVEVQKNRAEQFANWMTKAVAEAKDHRYDIAISLLERVRTSVDYRHAEVGENAQAAIEKIRQLRDNTMATANDLQAQAQTAFEAGDLPQVIALLKRVPPSLLTEASQQTYGKCSTFLEQVAALTTELQSAMKSRDWPLLGGLLNQLISLDPENAEYKTLAKKVSAKIHDRIQLALSKHDYDRASEWLQSVPDAVRDEAYQTLVEKVENIRWYSTQFSGEPFATPLLGRLAVRFSKEAPEDESVQLTLKQLSKAVKQVPASRHGYNGWEQIPTSWLGGELGVLATPQSIDGCNRPELRKLRGRFSVAFGLALQGLGRARVTDSFFAPKKNSMLSALSRRKVESAWGIDIGTTALRAIRLEIKDDKVSVADLQVVPFDSPLCRSQVTDLDAEIRSAVETLVDGKDKEFKSTPVWINLSTSDIVNRFVCLPPIKDKQAQQMLESETVAAIPLPLDEINVVRWIADLSDDATVGRPAMVCAARKKVVERRVENCQEAGLNVAGMQSDSVAIINFAAHEFAAELAPPPTDPVADQDPAADQDAAIAIVDCGAITTNVIVISHRKHTLWTIDTGSENLTTLLSRSTKTTHCEAEKLKLDPALIDRPAGAFEPLEQQMETVRERLVQTVLRGTTADADESPIANVMQTWCVGGGSLSHGWMRRVMLPKGKDQ